MDWTITEAFTGNCDLKRVWLDPDPTAAAAVSLRANDLLRGHLLQDLLPDLLRSGSCTARKRTPSSVVCSYRDTTTASPSAHLPPNSNRSGTVRLTF